MRFFRRNKDTKTSESLQEHPVMQGLLAAIDCADDSLMTFLHNTRNESTAQEVLKNGFHFLDHLDYTCDLVTPKDPLTIRYFNLCRQAYGKYTLIIQIARTTIENYARQLKGKPVHFSEILSLHKSKSEIDAEFIHVLPPAFVKGYFDHNHISFQKNPSFDPFFTHPVFAKNLQAIQEQFRK